MVDIYEYLLTPKYEHIVKGFTEYKNYDERKPYFNLVRIFQSVEIELATYAPLEESTIEIASDGESIWKALKNKYHCYYFTRLKGYFDIDFSYEMPEDVREKLKENPNYDLEEELGWYNNYDYWNDGSDSESESEVPEEKLFDDVWAYTPFSVSFVRHKPPPPLPPPPPPRPENPYEFMLGPLEEIHLLHL
jgi:hypothetical protein